MGDGPPASLTDPWTLGPLSVPNRVLLAPLAGIGNWFVRLQAKRYGAGMAVSEMVSSHAIHYRNEKTCTEMLRIDPRERDRRGGGPVAIQLFGEDPATMRSAAAFVAAAGADAIDINMGCPVPKVRKTGAGAELLADPDRAVAVARAAVDGAAAPGATRPCPVTVKLRSGLRRGREQRLRARPPPRGGGRGRRDRLPPPLGGRASQGRPRLRARRRARAVAARAGDPHGRPRATPSSVARPSRRPAPRR